MLKPNSKTTTTTTSSLKNTKLTNKKNINNDINNKRKATKQIKQENNTKKRKVSVKDQGKQDNQGVILSNSIDLSDLDINDIITRKLQNTTFDNISEEKRKITSKPTKTITSKPAKDTSKPTNTSSKPMKLVSTSSNQKKQNQKLAPATALPVATSTVINLAVTKPTVAKSTIAPKTKPSSSITSKTIPQAGITQDLVKQDAFKQRRNPDATLILPTPQARHPCNKWFLLDFLHSSTLDTTLSSPVTGKTVSTMTVSTTTTTSAKSVTKSKSVTPALSTPVITPVISSLSSSSNSTSSSTSSSSSALSITTSTSSIMIATMSSTSSTTSITSTLSTPSALSTSSTSSTSLKITGNIATDFPMMWKKRLQEVTVPGRVVISIHKGRVLPRLAAYQDAKKQLYQAIRRQELLTEAFTAFEKIIIAAGADVTVDVTVEANLKSIFTEWLLVTHFISHTLFDRQSPLQTDYILPYFTQSSSVFSTVASAATAVAAAATSTTSTAAIASKLPVTTVLSNEAMMSKTTLLHQILHHLLTHQGIKTDVAERINNTWMNYYKQTLMPKLHDLLTCSSDTSDISSLVSVTTRSIRHQNYWLCDGCNLNIRHCVCTDTDNTDSDRSDSDSSDSDIDSDDIDVDTGINVIDVDSNNGDSGHQQSRQRRQHGQQIKLKDKQQVKVKEGKQSKQVRQAKLKLHCSNKVRFTVSDISAAFAVSTDTGYQSIQRLGKIILQEWPVSSNVGYENSYLSRHAAIKKSIAAHYPQQQAKHALSKALQLPESSVIAYGGKNQVAPKPGNNWSNNSNNCNNKQPPLDHILTYLLFKQTLKQPLKQTLTPYHPITTDSNLKRSSCLLTESLFPNPPAALIHRLLNQLPIHCHIVFLPEQHTEQTKTSVQYQELLDLEWNAILAKRFEGEESETKPKTQNKAGIDPSASSTSAASASAVSASALTALNSLSPLQQAKLFKSQTPIMKTTNTKAASSMSVSPLSISTKTWFNFTKLPLTARAPVKIIPLFENNGYHYMIGCNTAFLHPLFQQEFHRLRNLPPLPFLSTNPMSSWSINSLEALNDVSRTDSTVKYLASYLLPSLTSANATALTSPTALSLSSLLPSVSSLSTSTFSSICCNYLITLPQSSLFAHLIIVHILQLLKEVTSLSTSLPATKASSASSPSSASSSITSAPRTSHLTSSKSSSASAAFASTASKSSSSPSSTSSASSSSPSSTSSATSIFGNSQATFLILIPPCPQQQVILQTLTRNAAFVGSVALKKFNNYVMVMLAANYNKCRRHQVRYQSNQQNSQSGTSAQSAQSAQSVQKDFGVQAQAQAQMHSFCNQHAPFGHVLCWDVVKNLFS